MSLRRRLVIGLFVLVGTVIGTAFVANFVAMRSFLTDRLDTQLEQTPLEMIGFLCDAQVALPVPQPPFRYFIAQVSDTGAPLPRCRGIGIAAQGFDLPAAEGRRLVASVRTPIGIRAGDLTLRAVAAPLPGAPHRYGVAALSTVEIDATLRRLAVVETVLGGLALAVAAGVGLLGVRRSLRPLQQITGTARAVTDDVSRGRRGLDRRVPAGPPGTEVGQLATAFNQMLTEVQTEVTARQDNEERMRRFLADASHELRTPLTSLRGYAELLRLRAARDGDGHILRRELLDALWRVETEGTRMARLVDDLLTLARSDQHEPAPHEPVHLDRLAADVVADLRAAHPLRSITLTADPACVVTGNADQLRQVITNLVDNAAVHTREPGGIRVVVRNRHDVMLIVDDDGPGLSGADSAHVFDRFWRADVARTRVRGGSGLGLSIADALVDAHGGTIDFRTSPTTGTTVTVELPRASAP